MKLLFFKKTYKLNQLQSETLKVAVLDALRFANDELAGCEPDTKEFVFLTNKVNCLEDVLKELGLTYDV